MKKSNRKDVKKAWLGIKMIISMGDCSQAEMKQLQAAEKDFTMSLMAASTAAADNDDVMRRREMCEQSEDMQEILNLFWFVVSQDRDISKKEITKQGYIQFNLHIQRYSWTSQFRFDTTAAAAVFLAHV